MFLLAGGGNNEGEVKPSFDLKGPWAVSILTRKVWM